jgi:hypothetical protein
MAKQFKKAQPTEELSWKKNEEIVAQGTSTKLL